MTDSSTELAQAKRFLELFVADPSFRERTVREPDPLAQRLRPLWQVRPPAQEPDPLVQAYRQRQERQAQERALARDLAAPSHPVFRRWRERQIRRASSQLGPHVGSALVHHPVAIELSLGCSVGCSFCGVSAPPLRGHARYADQRSAWRDLLNQLQDRLGPALGQGVLYWATDPLDHPDYESYCADFVELTGVFPPLTTALADRCASRTRSLIRLAQQHRARSLRFSVLSLGQLRRLHQEFSAEELAEVELVLQNRGSLTVKAATGRALPDDRPGLRGSTIACVSGLLINLVSGAIRVISPCPASDRWPDGFRCHAEDNFRTHGAEATLSRLISPAIMPPRPPTERPVRLREDLAWDGQRLQGRFGDCSAGPHWLLDALAQEPAPPRDLAQRLAAQHDLAETLFYLDHLYQQGVLDDDPA